MRFSGELHYNSNGTDHTIMFEGTIALTALQRDRSLVDDVQRSTVDAVTPVFNANDTLSRGYQPYRLDEIQSPDQFLSEEHTEEFWPEYRQALQIAGDRVPSKFDCLMEALPSVLHPQPRDRHIYTTTEAEQLAYGRSLGLILVAPRSEVGFSDERHPTGYVKSDSTPTVVQVGSFLSYEQDIREAKTEELPWGLTVRRRRFLEALASKLAMQL